MNQHQNDIQLMRQIEEGNQQALSALYDRYGTPIYSLSVSILGSKEQAEEVTQDVFMTVWNRAETWNPDKGKLISWLLSITRYRSIDRLRREKRAPSVLRIPLDEMSHLTSHTARVDDPQWDNGRILQRLIKELPPEQAQVIRLAFFKGLSHSEIANATGLPLGTVKTRVRSGLQKLKGLWLQEADTIQQPKIVNSE